MPCQRRQVISDSSGSHTGEAAALRFISPSQTCRLSPGAAETSAALDVGRGSAGLVSGAMTLKARREK